MDMRNDGQKGLSEDGHTPLPMAISEAQVLTRATIVAAERLGIDMPTLAAAIAVSESSVERMRRFEDLLRKGTPPCDRALLLIRLFRALDGGGNPTAARAWMQTDNSTLGGRPVEMIGDVGKVLNILAYLGTAGNGAG